MEGKSGILQGTLDLMVLKTLEVMGPIHGYGIARRIEQISQETLRGNQGTIYLCLTRLTQKRWIAAGGGLLGSNREGREYSFIKAGDKTHAADGEDRAQVPGALVPPLD